MSRASRSPRGVSRRGGGTLAQSLAVPLRSALRDGRAKRYPTRIAREIDFGEGGIEAETIAPIWVENRNADLVGVGDVGPGNVQLEWPDIAASDSDDLGRVRTTGSENAKCDAFGPGRQFVLRGFVEPIERDAMKSLDRISSGLGLISRCETAGPTDPDGHRNSRCQGPAG